MPKGVFMMGLLMMAIWATDGGRSIVAQTESHPEWLAASPHKLPRWRGFNLLEKFYFNGQRRPFLEEDFRLIAKLGFNFVRLPMDYRCWIKNGNWEEFDEECLKEIDQAVEWGNQYGIHVCLNFHRAPGYTVARPPEPRSLWTDPEAQRVCALHWATFARRYRGIPSERLSFNLMNEPGMVKPEVYVEVVSKLVEAIRKEDPNRLIIADGINWGRTPVLELAKLNIAQATRGYTPMEISHYKASWVGGERFPTPTWPRLDAPGILYGSSKKEFASPLVIEGPFVQETVLRFHLMTVSQRAKLIVQADEKNLWEKEFICGPGEGEWKKAEFRKEWNIYQNLYDRDYEVTIPAGSKKVSIFLTEGDWLSLSEVGLKAMDGSKEDVLPLSFTWGKTAPVVRYTPESKERPFHGVSIQDKEWLWQTTIAPWKEAEAAGIGVMVGEFGAFNKTPHDVVLRWMEDCLANWKKAGWGWALWNFRGSFGILDSGREDVIYEDFEGHKLDRKMLELLQRY